MSLEILDDMPEVKIQFDVDENGIVRSPGKFELEPAWVVLANERAMIGEGEDYYNPNAERTECTYWDVDDETRKLFELDNETVAIVIYYSNDGFVSGNELTEEEFTEFLGMLEQAIAMDCDW